MKAIRRINGKITREYSAWKAMKSRCNSPSTNKYNYRKNNITVCKEWNDSFENFLTDMGNCPIGYSLDRIDNDGNYSPNNCRWTDSLTQSGNRGKFNKLFTYNNETKHLKEWSKILNIKYTTLYSRIYRNGTAFEDAIQEDPYNKLVEYKGELKTITEWCNYLHLPRNVVIDRRFQGWGIKDCFEIPIKKVKI